MAMATALLHALVPLLASFTAPLRSGLAQRQQFKTAGGVSIRMLAAPKRKGIDSYQTVTVACSKCDTALFKYKKKNGLKSNLIKCYVERIVKDEHNLLAREIGTEVRCPQCESNFARDALIHGRPALKMIGGKVRMRK